MKISRRRLEFGLSLLASLGLIGGLLVVPATTAHSAPSQLRVLTLNTWLGGTRVDDGLNKIVRLIRDSGADVVALQEKSGFGDSMKAIADGLGWNYTASKTDVDVASALPIEAIENTTLAGANTAGAKINGIWIYSTHLDYLDYGPYNACFDHDSTETILADESQRAKQADAIQNWAQSYSPQILMGDFNTPSHLDWTAATKESHCGYAVEWPATKILQDARWTDTYRAVNPDPVAAPGLTWVPPYTTNSDYENKPEPQDRIDFIFTKNPADSATTISATAATTLGATPDWPSDHHAVLSTISIR
ncbi:endonuclease/exonuclease/phosphatase family protein [Nocardia brasiliensis]